MGETAFDRVSGQYGSKSLVQQSAARKLIDLLDLRHGESVLDVACGPGNLTRLIADTTGSRVVGTDISAGMIERATESYPLIEFRRIAAEDLDYDAEFDVVFCNSALQWFGKPHQAVSAMHRALETGGRLGLSCPSTPDFAPCFLEVVAAAAVRPEIAPTFAHWRKPWFHLPDEAAYRSFFEECGFSTRHIEMAHETAAFKVEDAFGIWVTGAARGFVGADYYDVELTEDYLDAFSRAVREEMESRAREGLIEVDFNRLYYIGGKPA